ncbi:MAG TPA: hypothetical protein VGB63_16420 [Pedobacter sp.]
MLHQFTWQHFLIAALIFLLIWYLAVFIYCHRKSSGSFFASLKQRQPQRLTREWEADFEDDSETDDDLIGRPVLPEGVGEVSMHMLGFASKVAENRASEDDRFIQLGVLPDVLEELKRIFNIIERENGTKEHFNSLFALILSKHPGLANMANSKPLNQYLTENLPFELSDEDLNKLWA